MAVHDWGEDESGDLSVPFLVSELLEGGSLRDMLDDGTVCSASQVIAFGIDACRALHYAHGQGIVHRDITPANLMFNDAGTLNVADFGLAQALADSGWTEPGKTLVGTARYSSPEQAQGLRLSPASDVYSLGLILIEALSGSVPFSADTLLGTLAARVESDVSIPDTVPPRLAAVLKEMTQRDPDARPSAHDAGVGMLGAAKGMPRPAKLPLVGLPVGRGPADEVFEPSSRPSSNPGHIAGTKPDHPVRQPDELADVDPDADPDVTIAAIGDRTTVAETPVVEVGEIGDEPARRWPVLLLTVGVLAAVGWFGWLQFSGGNIVPVEVPDVTTMELEDALLELGNTWVLDEKLERDADIAQGSVIRTNPVAGELLDPGEELSYWVSLGLPLIRVPESDLIGRSEEQVTATLEDLQLAVGNVDRVNSEDIGEGNVISVVTDALELPLGESVDLVVSLGPANRVIPEVNESTDVDQLIIDLEAAGLGVSRIDAFDDVVALGGLVSVEPEPGTAVERGAQVEVTVSLGPAPVPIPVTSGNSLSDTLDVLEDLGFLQELEGDAACPVVGTDPAAGTSLQPGAVVKIITSECR